MLSRSFPSLEHYRHFNYARFFLEQSDGQSFEVSWQREGSKILRSDNVF